MDTTRLNLILSTPVVPKENILLIEGIHDLFAERQPIEELWQKWEQPEIWRLPHGHIGAQLVLGLMGACFAGWHQGWKPVEKTTHDCAFGKLH